MHGLLAIALTMYPMRIDESIHTQLREKYGDKMLRMQKGWERNSFVLLYFHYVLDLFYFLYSITAFILF